MSIYKAQFWKDSTTYAVRGMAHTLILLWGGTTFNLLEISDLKNVVGVALGAVVLSYLTSIAQGKATAYVSQRRNVPDSTEK